MRFRDRASDIFSFPVLLIIAVVGSAAWNWWSHRSQPDIVVVNGVSYFQDVRCSKDCSGHKAGYEWAQENGIHDADDCHGKSKSFVEGCHIYVEESDDYYPDDPDQSPM